MKLLSSVLPRGGRLLTEGGWFTLAVCGFVVGLELLGRYAAVSDFHDGLAAFALMFAIGAVAARHRRAPIGWVSGLGNWFRRIGASVATLRYDHGIDLRGAPPMPRRTPPAVWLVAVLLVVWSGLAAGAWALFPTGWRLAGTYSSYTLYLVFLMFLWLALLAVTFVGVFVPVAVLDKMLKRWLGDTDRRGAELAAVVGYAVLVSAVAWVVPPAAILALCLAVVVGAWLVYLPRGSDGAALLWRSAPDRPVYAVPIRRVLAIVAALTGLLVFAVLLTACGGRLFGPPRSDDTMPVTALFGAVAAWLMPGLLLVLGLRLWAAAERPVPTHRAQRAREWKRPGRGAAGRANRSRVGLECADRAGAATGRASGSRGRVAGAIGGQGVRPAVAAEGERRGPPGRRGEATPRPSRRDSGSPPVLPRIAETVQARQRLQGTGRRRVLARAAVVVRRGNRPRGRGRRGRRLRAALVGPPYSRALPPRARQHAHAVLRATHVDMIFVEDGVTFKNLERVLRIVTELYDVHGGTKRAEELHFRGLPKVKVMIHEYEPGNPFRSDLYPEPKFDDLSRVRVLHVFRDRGGHEERVDPPFDFSWTPAPAPALTV